ncbi:hypothetical protein B0H19DRAFT_1080994 [Mycena capillaripes]|nr:hypothetical protein B0H19DRAFT_1080994 [Mycena capillaripes]
MSMDASQPFSRSRWNSNTNQILFRIPFGPVLKYKGEEFNGKITDDFHLHQILVPAVEIAQAVRREASPLTASPTHNQFNITGDLFVYTRGKRERGFIWVIIEDKTSSVFAKHGRELLPLIQHDTFQFSQPHGMDGAPAEMPMLIRIWGQMVMYDAYIANVLSPIGVHYIRRQLDSNELVVPRLYDNLDGRTLCLILDVCEPGDQLAA